MCCRFFIDYKVDEFADLFEQAAASPLCKNRPVCPTCTAKLRHPAGRLHHFIKSRKISDIL